VKPQPIDQEVAQDPQYDQADCEHDGGNDGRHREPRCPPPPDAHARDRVWAPRLIITRRSLEIGQGRSLDPTDAAGERDPIFMRSLNRRPRHLPETKGREWRKAATAPPPPDPALGSGGDVHLRRVPPAGRYGKGVLAARPDLDPKAQSLQQ